MSFSKSVKILDQSFISPPPLPAGEARPSLPLSIFDVIWLLVGPVERLFFYQYPYSTSHFLDSHLPILKSSLSRALSTFYPLAASIRCRPDGRFEIATADSDSVSLAVFEYAGDAVDFVDIAGDHSRPVEKLLPLVPRLSKSGDSQPLLAIQITLFSNHGLCLALAPHHSACDGFSSMQFVKSWSASAAAAFQPDILIPQIAAPIVDRSVIPDPRTVYSHIEKAVLDAWEKERMVTTGRDGGVFMASFTLSTAEIGRLKKAVEQGMLDFHCSSFVVSCAYSWICFLKTRRITDEEGKARLVFAVDWRRRSRAAIPANYFGNYLTGCFVTWDAEELLSNGGILVACAAIGKAIDELGDDPNESFDAMMDRYVKASPWRPLSLVGSPKLGVYETDFGWGRPGKVEVISTRKTGAFSLAESRDGEGGIEIGVILPEEELKAFANYFAAGMNW